jgi:putative heme iron utilization protein
MVTGMYFVGCFGIMGWIAAEDYGSARADPLVDAAAGIIQHMNADYAAARRLIARHYSAEAAMTAVDRLGFHLRLKSGERVYGRRVAFLREVQSSEDARGVLMKCFQASWSKHWRDPGPAAQQSGF